uniref:Uncharacterized protein n=1 Tax=viral metagenome TaxID=1070528 RepID=A0A6C0LQ12_9ZZZZ
MSMNSHLKKFLKNYKPKILDNYISPYLLTKKLSKYKLLKREDLELITPNHTYIRYVKHYDAFKNKKYEEHIFPGGFFINGGYYCDGRYIITNDCTKWTHILLKYKPHFENDDSQIEKDYIIKLDTSYIFFYNYRKKFDIDNIYMLSMFSKLNKI